MRESSANLVICSFAYAHDRTGSDNHLVEVAMFPTKEIAAELLDQVDEAADTLAELVESGKILERAYTFDEGRLIPGLPK